MEEHVEVRDEPVDYRSLGLVANPFIEVDDDADEAELVAALDRRASTNRALVALDAVAAQLRPVPVWVEAYGTAATDLAAAIVERAGEADVLAAHVPHVASGRIRVALHALATAVVESSYERTLVELVRFVGEQDPDEELPAWESLGEQGWQSLLDEFEESPQHAVTRLFITPLFQERVEQPVEEPAEEDGEPVEPAAPERLIDPAARYILDYVGAHHSKALARALAEQAFVDPPRFADSIAGTKAPRKALGALVWLVGLSHKKAALVVDGLDEWLVLPEEERFRMALSYAELRFHAGPGCVEVFVAGLGSTPELSEIFAGGERVVPVEPLEGDADSRRVDLWMSSATHKNRVAPTLEGGPLAGVWESEPADLRRFSAIVARAFKSAAERQAASVEESDVEATGSSD